MTTPTLTDDQRLFLGWLAATTNGVACWDAGGGRWYVIGEIWLTHIDAQPLIDAGWVAIRPGGQGGKRLVLTADGRAHFKDLQQRAA